MKLTYDELTLQRSFVKYIKYRYPDAIILASPADSKNAVVSGIQKGVPDLSIFYQGKMLGIELKTLQFKKKLILKNGSLSKHKHIQEQNAVHEQYKRNGAIAGFACGFEEAKSMLESYFN